MTSNTDPSKFTVLQRFRRKSITIHRNVCSLCPQQFFYADVYTSYNVTLAKPGVQLMATGAHTMQEITCGTCSAYLGWKIVRAHESSETWKEGYSLLELENLRLQSDLSDTLNPSPNPRRTSSSSGSESDYDL